MTRTTSFGLTVAITYVIFLPYEDHYITDWGNGVVIRGDRYVQSGDWVYNCIRWHLISKTPKIFPAEHFVKNKKLRINSYLSDRKEEAESFIKNILSTDNWHESLSYVFTHVNEDSQIDAHYFRLFSMYKGELWVLKVTHRDNLNIKAPYSISADPYDSRYYRSREELLQEAKKSCPKPQ